MADSKDKKKGGEKKERKPSSSSGHSSEDSGGSNMFVDTIFWILLVLVAYSVLKGILSAYGISFGLPSATSFFEFVFEKMQIYSVFLSLIFFIGIIYFNFKIGELAHQDHHRIHGHSHSHTTNHSSHTADAHHKHTSEAPSLPKAFKDTHSPSKRWEMVLTRLNSFSEGDWRLSIIEADIVLNEMLSKMGLEGDGVAERLKRADKSSFNTLDIAWEAHKFRNRVAHEGATFHLTHDDAKRTIEQYKQVFDEFYFV